MAPKMIYIGMQILPKIVHQQSGSGTTSSMRRAEPEIDVMALFFQHPGYPSSSHTNWTLFTASTLTDHSYINKQSDSELDDSG